MADKACIVGAGISGLCTAKAFLDHGIEFDLLEQEESFGGVWLYKDGTERFSVYRSCHTIASKKFMEFSDFPISNKYLDYMSNQRYLDYIEEYVEAFKLVEHISFGTTVDSVSKSDDGTWSVTATKDGRAETRVYRDVVIATGLFRTPKYPSYFSAGTEGQTHAAYYRTPAPYEGKNVLVVGLGNSGADIACDLVSRAAKVSLSTRGGSHVFTKYVFGKPFLDYTSPYDGYMPFPVQQVMASFLMWLGRGSVTNYGLPKPDHKILVKNPVVSSRLLDMTDCGDIAVRPGIGSLDGNTVTFDDGSVERFDGIVFATGYAVDFPFFDTDLLDFKAGRFANYLNIVNLQHANLYFVGLIDLLGTIPPVVELQAKYLARLLSGSVKLPAKNDMAKQVEFLDRKMRKRFKLEQSDEPVIMVEVDRYHDHLRRLMR